MTHDPEVTAMTLTINDTTMTSDQTPHTARLAPGRQYEWEVSWLPGQVLDRNTAITAMILADTAAEHDLHEGHRLWPHIQSWAARSRPDRTRRDHPGLPAAPRPRSRPGTSQRTAGQGRRPADQPARHNLPIARQRGTRRPAAGGRDPGT